MNNISPYRVSKPVFFLSAVSAALLLLAFLAAPPPNRPSISSMEVSDPGVGREVRLTNVVSYETCLGTEPEEFSELCPAILKILAMPRVYFPLVEEVVHWDSDRDLVATLDEARNACPEGVACYPPLTPLPPL